MANLITRGIQKVTQAFINWLPENANRQTTGDIGNVSKTSPSLFDYDVFRINWEKVATLQEIDEMMKADPRLKRANHVYASTAIRRGMTVKVTSAISESLAQRAQEEIDGFLRRTQMNSKLTPWARSLLKDGELFLNPIIDIQQRLITDVKNLPSITMQRNEDVKGRFADSNDAFRQIDPISRLTLTNLPLWSVNHIRFDHESGQLYGNSQYLGCRAVWKKLTMTEEDLVVRRRTRAFPRRLHKVGNEKNPGSWDEIKKYKSFNSLDKPKSAAVTTDYYGNGLTDIKDLNGDAQLDHIKDVEYLQDLLMIGTAVPLHLLGFGRNVNRDIVEDQKKQFDEDVQELRDLLEYGDESPFSGMRALFDFQLMLRGINPEWIDYNISWAETNNETIDNKVDRVVKLRASQPTPLISAKTSLAYLGRDLNFENQEAIDAELEAIKEEMEEDFKTQQTIAAAINPAKPSPTPAAKSTAISSGKPTVDSEGRVNVEEFVQALLDAAQSRESKAKNPLRSKKVVELEKSLADEIRSFFARVKQRMIDNGVEAKIEKVLKLKPHFDSTERLTEETIAILTPHAACNCSACQQVITDEVSLSDLVEQHVIEEFNQAWADEWNMGEEDEWTANKKQGTFKNSLIDAMVGAARYAFENVDEQVQGKVGVTVSTQFVHSGVKDDLAKRAGEDIKGIENTTKQLLRKEFAAAYENGETLSEWMDRIDSVMDIPEWRSSMIARTEISWAYNRANLTAYDLAGVTKVKYVAVWDKRTCTKCKEAAEGGDNGVYDITSIPSVPQHPRCRCTTIAVD